VFHRKFNPLYLDREEIQFFHQWSHYLTKHWSRPMVYWRAHGVRGHDSNVEQWAFWFQCGTTPVLPLVLPLVLQMDSTLTHIIADMCFFRIRSNSSWHLTPIGRKWQKGSKGQQTRIRMMSHTTGHQGVAWGQWPDMSVSERSERHLLPHWKLQFHISTKKPTVPHSSNALVLEAFQK
jgi:hypothetical protein